MREVVNINKFANNKLKKINKIREQEMVFRNKSFKKLLGVGVVELVMIGGMIAVKDNFNKLLFLLPVVVIGWNVINAFEEFRYKYSRVRKLNKKAKQLNNRCYK